MQNFYIFQNSNLGLSFMTLFINLKIVWGGVSVDRMTDKFNDLLPFVNVLNQLPLRLANSPTSVPQLQTGIDARRLRTKRQLSPQKIDMKICTRASHKFDLFL